MRGGVLALLALLATPAQADPAATAELLAERVVPAAGAVLPDIARARGLGFVELQAANPGIDPWHPAGAVVLPAGHLAPEAEAPLVVNLGDMRLYHTGADGRRDSYPIGIGRDGMEIVPGTETRVVGKRTDPTWVPPPSVRADKPWLPARVPPGPDNPLGAHSLDLGFGLIRIHGTNRPDGVGRRVSYGCIRLYPEDIARLFEAVPVGTRVLFVDQPAKLAWLDGELWLEIHPSQAQADAVEYRRPLPPDPVPGLGARVRRAAGESWSRIDWDLVTWAERTRLGVPVRITRPEAGPPLDLLPWKKRGPEDMPPGLEVTGRTSAGADTQWPAR